MGGEHGTAELGANTILKKKKILTMFLETDVAFPYCNWSIKMAIIIWLDSISVDTGPMLQVWFASVLVPSSAVSCSP